MTTATELKKPSADQDNDVEDEKTTTDSDTPGEGHNSGKLKEVIVECAGQMVDIDGDRKGLNRRASDIRETLSDYGIDKEAFKEAYAYYKKKHHERDGFDDSSKLCHDALGDPKQKDLFDLLKDAA